MVALWPPREKLGMKLLMPSQSRVLTPSILLGAIISATIVLTAYADLTNCSPTAHLRLPAWSVGGGVKGMPWIRLGETTASCQTGLSLTRESWDRPFVSMAAATATLKWRTARPCDSPMRSPSNAGPDD